MDEKRVDPYEVAAVLRTGLSLLVRRMKQAPPTEGELTMPEVSALSRLDRGGPTTAADLARQEQISPQSMGATLFGLFERGYLEKHPDPTDGRRQLLSLTAEGAEVVRQRRSTRTELVATALSEHFSPAELATLQAAAPLLERLAEKL